MVSGSLDGREYDVDFETPQPAATDYGTLCLRYTPSVAVSDPRYYAHFTLSRLEGGRMKLLEFDEAATWSGSFRRGVRLEAGDYVLVSGTRLAGGEVLAEIRLFTVGKEATTEVDLILPEDRRPNEIRGTFDPEVGYSTAGGAIGSLHEAVGGGICVVGILGAGEEPTNHALNDIAAVRESLERLGTPILLLFESEENARRYVAADFPSLPSTDVFGTDTTGEVRRRIASGADLKRDDLPVIAVTDPFGRILYISSGYTIGLGERLVKELSTL